MALIVLAVLIGVVVFLFGLVARKRRIAVISSPAALLFVIWFFLASCRPNPEREFDRVFGARHRDVASAIRTSKPTFMDGHFISFRMPPADFETRIRPQFSEITFGSPPNLLLGQSLPNGWPSTIETATSGLHRQLGDQDVYLLYFPNEQTAYASIRYDQW